MRPEERAELVKLQNPKADVRRGAAEKLGELRSRGAAPDLVRTATGDPDPSVRRAAVLALAAIIGPTCAGLAFERVSDSAPYVLGALFAGSAFATNGTRVVGFNAKTIGRGGTTIGLFDSPVLMMTNPAGISFLHI